MIGIFDTSAAPHLHRGYAVCTDDTCPHASVTGIRHAHGPGGRVQVLRDPTATAPGADDRCAKVDCGIPRREHGRGIHAFVESAAAVVAREVPDDDDGCAPGDASARAIWDRLWSQVETYSAIDASAERMGDREAGEKAAGKISEQIKAAVREALAEGARRERVAWVRDAEGDGVADDLAAARRGAP